MWLLAQPKSAENIQISLVSGGGGLGVLLHTTLKIQENIRIVSVSGAGREGRLSPPNIEQNKGFLFFLKGGQRGVWFPRKSNANSSVRFSIVLGRMEKASGFPPHPKFEEDIRISICFGCSRDWRPAPSISKNHRNISVLFSYWRC